MKTFRIFLRAIILACLIVPTTAFASRSLLSGVTSLSFPRQSSERYGIELSATNGTEVSFPFEQPYPLSVEVTDSHGELHWLHGDYSSVTTIRNGWMAAGRIQSGNGSIFIFTDLFRKDAESHAIVMSRSVRVSAASEKDRGFATRFTMPAKRQCGMRDFDFLVPGIWYKQNSHVPPNFLASNLGDKDLFFREDRIPLPLVMMRNRENGATLLLIHIHGDPVTFPGDSDRRPVIDIAMKFGSVGVTNHHTPGIGFWYPGTEGRGTYVPKGGQNTPWASRFHPVRVRFEQRYSILLKLSRTRDYPDAVRTSWNIAWRKYRPVAPQTNTRKAYLDCMNLLAEVCHPYDGVDDIPFELTVPGGAVPLQGALSGEMGFVGQQIPSCAMVLRYGFDTHNAKLIQSATAIIDFWVQKATTPSGVLRTWYDVTPDSTRVWRGYPMHLRVASDGMNGVLRAWDIAKAHGENHPGWLRFAHQFGDWLVKIQNKDGSFFRTYDFNGAPINLAKDTTIQPIPFLVNLTLLTGDAKFLNCAEKAGEYGLETVNGHYAYVGGTPDNPNVTDKEAGAVAMESFLALYDGTHDSRYLKAAVQAAWFTETWTYGWNIPMPKNDPMCDFPKGRSTVGISLIATGHSGADNFMTRETFDYYRLYLLTGETQFRNFAHVIQGNSLRMMDLDRTMSYKMPGLQIEAMTLSIPRGHSVRMWLPWLTVGMLEPLIHFQATFGTMDISNIEKIPLRRQKAMDSDFAANHGFSNIARSSIKSLETKQ